MKKINDLLKPINKENPCGIDIRNSEKIASLYYDIKDTRNEARMLERKRQQGESADDPKEAWIKVSKQAETILEVHTKDLEIATWWLEANIRLSGLSGLQVGFELLDNLILKYFDGLFPRPDEDGIATMMAPLVALNGEEGEGTLIQPIYSLPITAETSLGQFALWEYEHALKLRESQSSDMASLESISKAASISGASFYEQLNSDLDKVLETFITMNNHLTECVQDNSPPYTAIKNALENYKEHLIFITSDAPFEVLNKNDGESIEEKTTVSTDEIQPSSKVMTREQALNTLSQISHYFSKNEPHSPLSFGLDRLVRWGRMPLAELMLEIMGDQNALANYARITGLPGDHKNGVKYE